MCFYSELHNYNYILTNNSWAQLLPKMCLIQLTGASIDIGYTIYIKASSFSLLLVLMLSYKNQPPGLAPFSANMSGIELLTLGLKSLLFSFVRHDLMLPLHKLCLFASTHYCLTRLMRLFLPLEQLFP